MDIGGPLRGTWLTVLVISIAFAAAGVAAAEPWTAPAGTALSAEGVATAAPSSPGSAATSVSPAGEVTPATIAPTVGLAAAAPSHDDTAAKIALWERKDNHGLYVSGRARTAVGTGSGCDVSVVSRSDVGKPDTAASHPSDSIASCDKPGNASDSDNGSSNKTGGSSNNSGGSSDSSGAGSDNGSSDKGGGGSGKGAGGDE